LLIDTSEKWDSFVWYQRIMSFAQARVLSFESRRAKEITELIRNNGGQPFVAPALIEVPLEENHEVFEFADRLYRGDFEMVILLTGVGTRLLQRVLATREPESRFLDGLRSVTTVVRGPKPAAVLREWQVPIAITVPEPNTWRELLEAVKNRPEKSVAVQEYGRPNPELINGLNAQGRTTMRVPVYQWKLPPDTGPLSQALDDLLAGSFEIAIFTTGVQIEHFLEFAEQQGKRDAAQHALQKIYIASIGPTCSESLRAYGITPSLEPSHPKMGILVHEAASQWRTN
jgi:uroporphyrinogen-III synthase